MFDEKRPTSNTSTVLAIHESLVTQAPESHESLVMPAPESHESSVMQAPESHESSVTQAPESHDLWLLGDTDT